MWPGSRLAYTPAAALVVRRKLVDFDPGLRHSEDVDLVWRLVRNGLGGALRAGRGGRASPARHLAGLAGAAGRVRVVGGATGSLASWPDPSAGQGASELGASAWLALADRYPFVAGCLLEVVAARLTRKLVDVPRALLIMARLVLRGQEGVAHQLADALTRVWLPLALPAGRRARLAVAVPMPVAKGPAGTAHGARFGVRHAASGQ